MPFSSSDVSISVTFQLATGKFLIGDTSGYAGAGINTADVNGQITIVGPDGQQFQTGSPGDIVFPPGTNGVINIPLDSNGDYQEGTYAFTYVTVVTGGVDAGTYSTTLSVDFCVETPEAQFTWLSDCYCEPVLTLTDATAYGSWVISSRVLTLYPPNNAPQNTPITGSGVTVNTGSTDVYAGLWAAGLETEVSRDYGTYTVTDIVSSLNETGGNVNSSVTYTLSCDLDVCSIRCCINAQYNRYITALQNGNVPLANASKAVWEEMVALYSMIVQAVECGKTDNVNTYLSRIRLIGNCTEDCCSGSDSTGGLIVPLCQGGGGSYTFQDGAGVTVTIAGSTITYALSASNVTRLAALYNAEVTTSDPYLTVTPTTNPGNPDTVTYDIATTGIPAQPEISSVTCEIKDVAGALTISINDKSLYGSGSVFDNTPSVTAVNAYPAGNAEFHVDQFYLNSYGGAGKFKAFVELQKNNVGGASPFGSAINIYDRSFNGGTPEDSYFRFALMLPSGVPMTYTQALQTFGNEFTFNITILE